MGHLTNFSLPSSGTSTPRAVGLRHYEGLAAFDVLRHASAALPGRTAIQYGDSEWTYAELERDVTRCAAMLQRLGVRHGDRVGILLPNVPEYVIAANAIWLVGGTVVAINPMMVAEEVDRLAETTDCRLVISLDLLSHLVKRRALLVSIRENLPALQQLGYLWKRHGNTGFWTLPTTDRCGWFWEEIDKTNASFQSVAIDPIRDTAYILPTGGTTGVPKAVALSHRNMVANAWQQYRWTQDSFGVETMLAVLPFFHSYGMSATVMGGAMMAATLVMHHRFNPRQVIRLIEETRPTVFHAVPAMLVAMNERLRTNPVKLDSIRWVISGGAPLDAKVGREFAEHTGALVVEGYGLSEASPVTHVGDLFAEPNYGTIGFPLPETECRIVDAGPGEVGELMVKGPQVMQGYWNDPEATNEAVRDGWLHTGDLAMQEPDGCYRIVGRKKELIITSGFNVYPGEVDKVICEHEDVLDAAVAGVQDTQRGEIVKAFIVLKPGVSWDEASLRAHCERRLSKYKRPRTFERCTELPKNFLGKVIRHQLGQPDASVEVSK